MNHIDNKQKIKSTLDKLFKCQPKSWNSTNINVYIYQLNILDTAMRFLFYVDLV